jgi:hypothetical protein
MDQALLQTGSQKRMALETLIMGKKPEFSSENHSAGGPTRVSHIQPVVSVALPINPK